MLKKIKIAFALAVMTLGASILIVVGLSAVS